MLKWLAQLMRSSSSSDAASDPLLGRFRTIDAAVYRFEKTGDEFRGFIEVPSTRANWGFKPNELVLKLRAAGASYKGQWKVFDSRGNSRWMNVGVTLSGDELITDPRDETGPRGWMRVS